MSKHAESHSRPTIAVLGGTGHFGAPFIHEFLRQGLMVRILARFPGKVAGRFPKADVCHGTMFNRAHVERAVNGMSAAFLITPVGDNDDAQVELAAARLAIKAAQATHLPHLIYLSLIQPFPATGVPMLDVKGQIETMLRISGLPFSSLRTGCYMDTWLSFSPRLMRLGIYPMPVGPCHRFSFTAQRDVARVAVRLIRNHLILNGVLDVVEADARSVEEVVALYQAATGRKVIPMGRWLLPVIKLLRPVLFRWLCPKAASRVALFNYFNSHDWIGDPRLMARLWPDFRVTTMVDFLKSKYSLERD